MEIHLFVDLKTQIENEDFHNEDSQGVNCPECKRLSKFK